MQERTSNYKNQIHSINSEDFLSSLKSTFISRTTQTNYLMPTLLLNDNKQGKKILDALTTELQTCQSFDFSVAFINDVGLDSMLQTLIELKNHNVPGRILTTNYLNFTTPGSLLKILEQFPNIELKAYTKGGFHPKGYIFEQSNYYSIIIGSANLTASALSENQEWSLKFLSLTDGQIVYSVREEFEKIWNESETITKEWIQKYSINYQANKIRLKKAPSLKEIRKEFFSDFQNEDENIETQSEEIEVIPNSMQKEAMISLAQLRAKNENRALLIAATGTGKTYLSIFDVKQFNAKKVLYVAHRDMILSKAEQSFSSLLPNIKTGFLNGRQKQFDAEYLFASIYTLSKDDVLSQFKKDTFDYIIVDEVHHAGAQSYKKVIDYFTPKFLLGLTATPERTDGFDIFALFHNNIPYEIRLQKALEENLLCPFHYYGISDLTVNGELIEEKSDFSKLVSNERIKHIEQALNLYRSYESQVKGLIFCSRIEEAKELCKKLNDDGFCTTYLSGEHSDKEREDTIQKLESDDNPLQYIISVDIFNEGVDIPCVNQVVMLRPTQSAIIFVQQLGRGLRKDNSKSYVSVIDFIGNYENNFFIPIALYGDNSYNKDNIRRALSNGSATLPGVSTIQIEEVAKQRIYDSINCVNFNHKVFLHNEYKKLRVRLGRALKMVDFLNNECIDPRHFLIQTHKNKDVISHSFYRSYYSFYCEVEKISNNLTKEENRCLEFISFELYKGIRIHEIILLKELIQKHLITINYFKEKLSQKGIIFYENDLQGCINVLNGKFSRKQKNEKGIPSGFDYVKQNEDSLFISDEFKKLINNIELKNQIQDILDYASLIWEKQFSVDIERNNLVRYQKYTRSDVFKLLNSEKDPNPQNVGGYLIQDIDGSLQCPIFVTYNKTTDRSASTRYDDVFIDNSRFSWMSKNKRHLNSPDVEKIIHQDINNINLYLFIKKNDSEGSEFYYLGKLNTVKNSAQESIIKNDNDEQLSVVNIQFDMQTPVPQNLYHYFEN